MIRLFFVANLAADLEFQGDHVGLSNNTRAQVAQRGQAWIAALSTRLGDEVRIVDAEHAQGAIGQAWCPTPAALDTLRALGAQLPPAPTVETLRRVNHRSFVAGLGIGLPGQRFVRTLDELLQVLAEPSPGNGFLLKRAFGFAGRQHKHVGPELDRAQRTWVGAAFQQADGGILVAPFVRRLMDVAIHGVLRPDGAVQFGRPTVQRIDQRGAWLASRPVVAGELGSDEASQLHLAAAQAAQGLHAAGYFGPFGLDAFRYQGADAKTAFCAGCDLNARYTMGFFSDGLLRHAPPWRDFTQLACQPPLRPGTQTDHQ